MNSPFLPAEFCLNPLVHFSKLSLLQQQPWTFWSLPILEQWQHDQCPAQQPLLMTSYLLIGDASFSLFALVKTEMEMYLSLMKCIHAARFALWVGPSFLNHLWPRDLNRPRAVHQTQPLDWPLITPEGTFGQTGYFESVFHSRKQRSGLRYYISWYEWQTGGRALL